jgi:rSAM/selenodomain-associated transferase 2
MLISVIIPTLNETATLSSLADSLGACESLFEIIVADGGSEDETVALAQAQGWQVVASARGRGTQMNAAARCAKGEVLLFLHADTRLHANAVEVIRDALTDERVSGGNFQLRFDGGTRAAWCLTLIYPFLRWGGMCYGDSAMFIRRTVFEKLGGYREYPIFEDVDLYCRLKRVGRFVCVPAEVTTSARRFEGRFIRTFARWSILQVLYWLGFSPDWLAQFYRPVR